MIKEPVDHLPQKDYSKEEEEYNEKRKNSKFVQLYEAKMKEIRKHTIINPPAVSLFFFLAEFMGRDNLVVVSQAVLMEELKLSRTTLWRATRYLEEENLVERVSFGSTHGYCLNGEYVWKSFNSPEKYTVFKNVTALASKAENEAVRKKLNHVFNKKKPIKSKSKVADSVSPQEDGSGGS